MGEGGGCLNIKNGERYQNIKNGLIQYAAGEYSLHESQGEKNNCLSTCGIIMYCLANLFNPKNQS